MNLIIAPSPMIFSFTVPRGTPAQEIINGCTHLSQKPDVSKRNLSDRSFYDAQAVFAEIEFTPKEKLRYQDVEALAQSTLGWCVADSRETAAFIYYIPQGFPNFMPESLLSDFSPKQALCFERKGWDHQVSFKLTICDLDKLQGLQQVLLVRKFEEK